MSDALLKRYMANHMFPNLSCRINYEEITFQIDLFKLYKMESKIINEENIWQI